LAAAVAADSLIAVTLVDQVEVQVGMLMVLLEALELLVKVLLEAQHQALHTLLHQVEVALVLLVGMVLRLELAQQMLLMAVTEV
jgi:hypothetical protein